MTSTAEHADSESIQQQGCDPEQHDTVYAGSIYAPKLSAVPSSSRYASTARRRGSTTTLRWEKLIATVKQQLDEVNCVEYLNKEDCGKKPESIVGMKCETKEVDDDSAQKIDFPHTIHENAEAHEYWYQWIKLKNTKTGKKPELTSGEKWDFKKVNGENAQMTGFLHATTGIIVPYDYLYQTIKQKNTVKEKKPELLEGM